MSLLVDTSVWSLALRRKGPADHPKVDLLQEALLDQEQPIFLIGIILQEILQAFRDEVTFQRMSDYLDIFPLLPVEREEAVEGSRIHRTCASHGIAASTTDCLIAAAAIRHGCRLLTNDKDFRLMSDWIPLDLVE